MRRFLLVLLLSLTSSWAFAQAGATTGPNLSTAGKIADSDDLVRPLERGAMIPDGTLRTAEGKEIQLKALVAQKPTVLLFYRGSWCPYCNEHLYKIQFIVSDLMRLGYQVLAVTPDNAYHLKEMAKRNQLTYTLLSDPTMELTKAFGLAYRVSPDMQMTLRKYGHNLEDATGNNLGLLPVPAAYIVNQKGKIVFSYYNSNFQKRVDPEALLRAAKVNLSASN